MSDKNRNMNDINDQKTAEQQAFSKEIRRRLAEPDSGKPTLDEFKVMVYKDREKRRKKRNALVACIVAAFIVGYLTYDDLVPEVGADKNPKETIQTEDGVIIEDGGWESSVEENIWLINDIEHVKDVKVVYPNIPVPQYVPKGYIFDELKVTTLETKSILANYVFLNKGTDIELEFLIVEEDEDSTNISDVKEGIQTQKGMLYFQEAEHKKATIKLNSGVYLSIWADIDDDEYVKIVNGIIN